eukprot:TRINITY_DN621_c5_g1_i1.p1 TRINITY_DN621_c5_g1~~TRINITY_DN621_c5_g1_i1.p1  ORF type:complete len:88 (+),score=7.08 TRINITY_DN621_c5_g1_i1:40-303(+)
MSQIPGEENPECDPYWVNVGEQNWHALRSNWKNRPDDFNPSTVKRTDPKSIDKTKVCDCLLTGKQTYRTPLPTLINVLVKVWESNPS